MKSTGCRSQSKCRKPQLRVAKLLAILGISLSLFACGNDPKADVSDAADAASAIVDARPIDAAVVGCLDTVMNNGESDVDCGGTCIGCTNGLMCGIAGDCLSGVCGAGNLCEACTVTADCGALGANFYCNVDTCEPMVNACPPLLNVLDDGSAASGAVGLPNLVMSEISPGNYIEVYNTTASPIALSGVTHQLCSPFSYVGLSTLGAGITVPANGYSTVPWPGSFTDVDAGGEIILYASIGFSISTSILDFVCWGTNPHGTRKTQAEAVTKWSGDCAPAITGGALHRSLGVAGTTMADYDSVSDPSGANCAP